MNYYDLPEWAAFLAAIRAAPDDDLPRLVAADWLDELETDEAAERAEFIRVQCELAKTPELVWRNKLIHRAEWDAIRQRAEPWGERFELALAGGTWVVDRGFVTRVSAPLAVLSGGGCRGGCEGGGRWAEWGTSRPCPHCRGTGRTPGVLGELLRREPVTAAGIEVVDREPSLNTTGNVCWFHEDVPHGSRETPDERRRYELATLPADVFDATPPRAGDQKHSRCQWYKSTAAARLALGEALYRLHGPKSEVLT